MLGLKRTVFRNWSLRWENFGNNMSLSHLSWLLNMSVEMLFLAEIDATIQGEVL
jgi:hypothetical protein